MSDVKNHSHLMMLHCRKIFSKMEGKTHQDWIDDENFRDAVCMRLLSLAECVKEYLKSNQVLTNEFPNIPWDNIVRFRDKIVHHYEGIDYDVVWGILNSDITPLYEVICEITEQNNTSPSP